MHVRKHGVGSAMAAVMMIAVVVIAAVAVYYSSTQRSTTTVTATAVATTETTTATATVTSTLPATTTVTVTQALGTSSSSSLACGTTTATSTTGTTSSSPAGPGLVDLARNFTSLSLAYGENSSGTSVIIEQSYNLVYASATTYKMTFEGSGSPGSGVTAWVLSNGTVLATESSGQNHTGAYASSLVQTSAPVFYDGLPALNSASQIPFPVSDLHTINSSNITLGSTRVTATNYRAKSPPLVYCEGGVPFSFSTVVIQTAPVPGKDFSLITYLDLQGTASSKPYSFYLSISSITLA